VLLQGPSHPLTILLSQPGLGPVMAELGISPSHNYLNQLSHTNTSILSIHRLPAHKTMNLVYGISIVQFHLWFQVQVTYCKQQMTSKESKQPPSKIKNEVIKTFDSRAAYSRCDKTTLPSNHHNVLCNRINKT
jgi:hypothetical protein